MNKVIVKVKSRQQDMDGEVNKIEMMAEGKHYYRNGKHYVLYEDVSLGEHGGVSTVLKIAPDSLLLLRKGGVEQEQLFRDAQESSSIYRTPYGDLRLSIRTNRLKIIYGNVSGNIEVDYTMSVNGQPQGANNLQIEVCAAADEKGKLN